MDNQKAIEILEKVKHTVPEVNEAFRVGAQHIKKWDYLKTTIINWSGADCSADYKECLRHMRDLIKEIEAQYK